MRFGFINFSGQFASNFKKSVPICLYLVFNNKIFLIKVSIELHVGAYLPLTDTFIRPLTSWTYLCLTYVWGVILWKELRTGLGFLWNKVAFTSRLDITYRRTIIQFIQKVIIYLNMSFLIFIMFDEFFALLMHLLYCKWVYDYWSCDKFDPSLPHNHDGEPHKHQKCGADPKHRKRPEVDVPVI